MQMTTYQVTSTEQTEEGTRFVLNTGDSIILMTNGRSKCFNTHGRGFSSNGRFAHIAYAMRRAAERFQAVAA
jgi:hypothetical protein